MTHGSEHEELLLRVAAGAVGEDDPDWCRRRADCAECADGLRDLRRLDREFDRVRVEAIDDLRAAAELRDVPGEERVEAAVRRAAAEPLTPARRSRPRWVLVLGVAAAAVLAFALVRTLLPRPAPAPNDVDELLGGLEAELDAPTIDAEGSLELRWHVREPTHGRYELALLTGPTATGPWVDTGAEHATIADTSWRSPSGFAPSLGAFLRWRVVEITPGGSRLSSAWVVHSLSR